jgi:hypothetical protein
MNFGANMRRYIKYFGSILEKRSLIGITAVARVLVFKRINLRIL